MKIKVSPKKNRVTLTTEREGVTTIRRFRAVKPEQGTYCFGCAFYRKDINMDCCKLSACVPGARPDHKHIIFKDIS